MSAKGVTIAIVGSRTFEDYATLESKTDALVRHVEFAGDELVYRIVSGGAKGADSLGEVYATDKRYLFKSFHPDWSEGKLGGMSRNTTIVDNCDYVIAFWDGRSTGTKDTIEKAKRAGKMTIRGKEEFDKCIVLFV